MLSFFFEIVFLRRQSLNRIANPERSSGAPIGKERANSVVNAEIITRALGPTPWFWSTRTLMKCDVAVVPKFSLAALNVSATVKEKERFYSHDN